MKIALIVTKELNIKIVLAGATLLASLAISLASIALPALARAFELPVSAVQWVAVAYLVSVTIMVVIAGWLGDRFGHHLVFVGGLALFCVSSFVCAVAPSFSLLVAARIVQGAGGAILLSVPLSIFRNSIAENRMGSAMGLIATMSALGTALGPSLGGILIAATNWRVAFLSIAVLSALIFFLALRIDTHRDGRNGINMKPLDVPGIFLLTTSLAMFAFATVNANVHSGEATALLYLFASAAMAIFIIVELRTASPLIEISVVKERALGMSLLTNLCVTTVMMSTVVVGPFYLIFGLGLNEALAGMVIATGPLTAAVFGIPAGRLTDRFGHSAILLAGLTEITIGLVAIAALPLVLGVAGYILALVLLTPGFQLFLTANMTIAIMNCRPEHRGVVSGLLGLSRNLGFMTGASVVATVFAIMVGDSIGNASSAAVQTAFSKTFLCAAVFSTFGFLFAYSEIRKENRSVL